MDRPFHMGDRLTLRLNAPEAREFPLPLRMEATFLAEEGDKWLLAEVVTAKELGFVYAPQNVYTVDPMPWVVEKFVAFRDRDDAFEGPNRPREEEEPA